MKRIGIVIGFSAVCWSSLTGAVYGWEADLHYGLTKWLAVKAGFSLDHAELIAAGNESADETPVLAATSIMKSYVCLKFQPSAEASRHLQRHHFPSGGFVPSLPQKRVVLVGNPGGITGGNRWAHQEAIVPWMNAAPKTMLIRFGSSLHPLSDSYSHQGVPDVPPLCRKNYAWSHPANRGGWSSHKADWTFLHVTDTIDTSSSIYHYMNSFLSTNGTFRTKSSAPWASLLEPIKEFSRGNTAEKKLTWFKSQSNVPWDDFSTYPCFLRSTSLEGHNKVECAKPVTQAQATPPTQESDAIDPPVSTNEPTAFADSFLTDWIVKEVNSSTIIEKYFSVIDVRDSLIQNVSARKKVNKFAWMQVLVDMWLLEDHGFVAARGHGMPEYEGYTELAGMVRELPRIKAEKLSDAIHDPGSPNPFAIWPVSKSFGFGQAYAISFKFRHTPRDELIFIASQRKGSWKIVGFTWLVD